MQQPFDPGLRTGSSHEVYGYYQPGYSVPTPTSQTTSLPTSTTLSDRTILSATHQRPIQPLRSNAFQRSPHIRTFTLWIQLGWQVWI